MNSQIIVLLVTIGALILFIIGKLRYDFIGLLVLLVLSITRVISFEATFLGFSHPAVITVAMVLIISSALIKTGAINHLVKILNKSSNNISQMLLGLMLMTAFLSAFMNNVGALAIVMPIALSVAKDNKISPSKLLMPIAFASLLGGMVTGIGTPPNLITSTYRMQAGYEPFPFFAFLPVGLSLAIIGILFTVVIGYRFIPLRESSNLKEHFKLEDYLFELVVNQNCPKDGIKLKDFFNTFKVNTNVVRIIRDNQQITAPGGNEKIFEKDILIVRALSDNLNDLITKTCLDLRGAKVDKLASEKLLRSDDVALVEVVLRDDSPLIGRTAVETRLRNRYNANLIAVSRKGISSIERLKMFKFESGDVLLLQAPKANLNDLYLKMRCLPLAERGVDLSLGSFKKEQSITLVVFISSILLATFNVLPVQIAFLLAAFLLVIFQVISAREFYEAIEWPTIIMIGSLFTLGGALESSGLSHIISDFLFQIATNFSPGIMVGLIMLLSIILTNLINNTVTSILMAPFVIGLASTMAVSPDPFLMAIAVGASSSFLTPIGHQSNTLIMGPGGYKFTDYWRLGLPLSLISLLIGVPLILRFWPL